MKPARLSILMDKTHVVARKTRIFLRIERFFVLRTKKRSMPEILIRGDPVFASIAYVIIDNSFISWYSESPFIKENFQSISITSIAYVSHGGRHA